MNGKYQVENCIRTGIDELDRIIGGFKEGELVLVSGRPGMGKTTFAMNLLDQVCRRDGKKAIVFSLEMSEEQFRRRYMELQSNNGVEKSDKGLIIDDTPLIPLEKIKERVENVGQFALVLIDYLQLLNPGSEYTNRALGLMVIENLRGLKELAVSYNVPVVVMGQLSRSCEMRSDHRPKITDLKYAKSVDDILDVILFLYRDCCYHIRETGDTGNQAEIIIAKHPEINRVPVTVSLIFDSDKGFYENRNNRDGQNDFDNVSSDVFQAAAVDYARNNPL